MGTRLLQLGTPAGGEEPSCFSEGLRAFTDKDTPVVSELSGRWSNYNGAKPPIFLSLVFLFVTYVVGIGLYGLVSELPSWTAVAPLLFFLVFGSLWVFVFFPLRRVWRSALRARIAQRHAL